MSLILGFDPLSLLLTFVLFFVFCKLLQKDEKAVKIDKLPGPMPLPLIGNLFDMVEPREKMLSNRLLRHKEFGPTFRIWVGHQPFVVLSKPEDIEIVLRSTKHSEKSSSYKFLHSWLGTGLLTSHGKKWAVHRKLITPTFHFGVLQSFVDVFQEKSSVLVSKLEPKAKTGEIFDIYPFITLCTLDIICETAMGTKINAQSESQNEYVKSVYALSTLVVRRMTRIWLYPDFIYNNTSSGKEYQRHLKVVQGFTESVIRARKEALQKKVEQQEEDEGQQTKKKKLTFLDLLLESSPEDGSTQLTDEELREEVDTFMFEGHDTTAAAINWALFLLGHHPKIQEEVYEEQKNIFQDDPTRAPTMTDLAEMKLLERVIKETLRLYPSVPAIGRDLEEDTQFSQYLVPKGTSMLLSFYVMHRNSEYYPEPEVFNPDRFLPEAKRHPYAFVPFSAGPRNCIGQKFAILEEKTVLSNVIRHYKFESVDDVKDIVTVPELILRPIYGLRMKITRR